MYGCSSPTLWMTPSWQPSGNPLSSLGLRPYEDNQMLVRSSQTRWMTPSWQLSGALRHALDVLRNQEHLCTAG